MSRENLQQNNPHPLQGSPQPPSCLDRITREILLFCGHHQNDPQPLQGSPPVPSPSMGVTSRTLTLCRNQPWNSKLTRKFWSRVSQAQRQQDRDKISHTQVEAEQPQVTLPGAASAQLGYNFSFLIRQFSRSGNAPLTATPKNAKTIFPAGASSFYTAVRS